jgi:hypothetical protein
MASTTTFAPGGYAYIPGVFQYSAGAVALPGFRIERVRFAAPVPLAHGFERVADHIKAAGRPLTAFCACELRSPAPFTEAGFIAFNRIYVGTLAEWGLFKDEVNPVARSNVCPELDPPAEPSFHAFAYTVAGDGPAPSFVIAGSGEAPEGKGSYGDSIVARGDTSAAGMRRKAVAVLGEMERRLGAMGASWRDTTAVQTYTVHDIHPFLGDELVRRGAARHGLTWHFCRPPVVELDYEMDCRGVALERVLA